MTMKNVYIAEATRTAVGKSGRGTLANYRPDDMAAGVPKSVIERSGLAPGDVGDISRGCALP